MAPARYAWGSIFLINPPLIAVALLGVWFLVPESKDPRAPRLDWPGAVLSVAGVTVLVYGITEQPADGWRGTWVLAGLIGGVVLLTVFAARQLRARSPLVDLQLFRGPRFTWSTVAIAMVMFALGGVLFILTPFLQIVQGQRRPGDRDPAAAADRGTHRRRGPVRPADRAAGQQGDGRGRPAGGRRGRAADVQGRR
jgi:MFS family permease